MVHLNKTELTSSQKKELLAQLNDTLGTLRKSQTNSFLSELLGKEERVMLAKRLAAIILLQEGASLYKVSEVLKISSSTAQNLRQKLDDGGFEQTMHILGKRATVRFWKHLIKSYNLAVFSLITVELVDILSSRNITKKPFDRSKGF